MAASGKHKILWSRCGGRGVINQLPARFGGEVTAQVESWSIETRELGLENLWLVTVLEHSMKDLRLRK